MEEDIKKESNIQLIVLAIIFVLILVVLGIASAYAYFHTEVDNSSSITNIVGSTDCVDVVMEPMDGVFNMQYNYPITDDFAKENVKPIEVKVINNCQKTQQAIPYTLTFTTLQSEGEAFIGSSKIKYRVERAINTETASEFKPTAFLNTLTNLQQGNVLTELSKSLDNNEKTSKYSTKTNYLIDSGTIPSNTTNTYKLYLWIDYYEGDESGKQGQGQTQGQTFRGAMTLLVNIKDNA